MIKRYISALLMMALTVWMFAGCSQDAKIKDYDFSPETSASTDGSTETTHQPVEKDRAYSVSCSSDLATDVAMAVLEEGGNAVDAAIALSYTLCVVEHYASGLGGSGGLLVYDTQSGECEYYDYRACSGITGYSSVAVPGFVKGMETVYNDYGTVSMDKLLTPAIGYAENGFKIGDSLAYRIKSAAGTLSEYAAFRDDDGTLLGSGDLLVQPELAESLKAIRQDGADVFYNGYIAEDICEATTLTPDDFSSYKVNKSSAVQGSFNGYTVYGAGVPLSGIVLIQMLKMAEKLDMPDPKEDSLGYLSDLSMLTSAAYSDRYYTITDPDFYEDTVDIAAYQESLISDEYINGLLGLTSTAAAGYDLESPETTSYSIVDSTGLVVCATNTLSSFWGSQFAVDGFFLNNTNNNFSSHGVNAYEAGKRSRTFTAPTIITGEDGYILAVGTPGGNNIPSVLFNVIVDLLKFGEEPQAAVDKPRFLYRGGLLTVETDEEGSTWLDLSGYGKSVIWHDSGYWWGSVSLAGFSETDGAFSAYDFRRGATKSGTYNPEK